MWGPRIFSNKLYPIFWRVQLLQLIWNFPYFSGWIPTPSPFGGSISLNSITCRHNRTQTLLYFMDQGISPRFVLSYYQLQILGLDTKLSVRSPTLPSHWYILWDKFVIPLQVLRTLQPPKSQRRIHWRFGPQQSKHRWALSVTKGPSMFADMPVTWQYL